MTMATVRAPSARARPRRGSRRSGLRARLRDGEKSAPRILGRPPIDRADRWPDRGDHRAEADLDQVLGVGRGAVGAAAGAGHAKARRRGAQRAPSVARQASALASIRRATTSRRFGCLVQHQARRVRAGLAGVIGDHLRHQAARRGCPRPARRVCCSALRQSLACSLLRSTSSRVASQKIDIRLKTVGRVRPAMTRLVY